MMKEGSDMKNIFNKVFIIVLCALIFTACSKNNKKSDSEQDKNLKVEMNIAIGKDINELNVHTYSGNMTMQNMVYEGLVKNTEKGPVPWLAEKWEISPDGTEYTFYLRKGVKFHDGTKFDAEAVKKNIDAIQKNLKLHSWLAVSEAIKHVEIVDDYTVKLILKYAYYPTLTELGLTRPYRFISPKAFKNGETMNGLIKDVGTGPYKLIKHDSKILAEFEVNEEHWKIKPEIKKINFKVMPMGQTTMLALEKGEIDFLYTADGAQDLIDADSVKNLKEKGKIQIIQSKPIASRYLVACTGNQNSPINEKSVRNAVWHGIDRKGMIKTVLGNSEDVAEIFFAKNNPYCNIDLENKSYDPQKAKKILDDAGWKLEEGKQYRKKEGKELSFRIFYGDKSAGEKQMMEFIQDNLKQIGIKCELIGEDRALLYDRVKGTDYELMIDATWGAPYDPPTMITSFTSPEIYKTATEGIQGKEEFIQDIKNVLKSTNEKSRQDLYIKILKKIHDEALIIPISFTKVTIVASKKFSNISFNQSKYEIPFEEFKVK